MTTMLRASGGRKYRPRFIARAVFGLFKEVARARGNAVSRSRYIAGGFNETREGGEWEDF